MNKDFYKNCIKSYIKELIEIKDNYSEEIADISTYIDIQAKDNNLNRSDTLVINEKRNNMGAIYKLIEDLDKLYDNIDKESEEAE